MNSQTDTSEGGEGRSNGGSGASTLVTGASGFIGLHLVRQLLNRGHRVSCLVRSTSDISELRAAGCQLITGDLTAREVASVLEISRPQTVFHLAGCVRAKQLAEFAKVNIGGTEAVASACAGQAQRASRPVLVLVSSLAAAGHTLKDTQPRTESYPPAPISAYGRSKLGGEHAAAAYARELDITVVRPCVVIGPGDQGMQQVFRPISRWGIHAVPGRGERRLSLLGVEDLVECLILAAAKGERLPAGGMDHTGRGVYFAAAESLSQMELGVAIARALGQGGARMIGVPESFMRCAGFLGDAYSMVRRRPVWLSSDKVSEILAGSWVCSSEKALRQLGWAPTAPLADRLRETAEWYRAAGWL